MQHHQGQVTVERLVTLMQAVGVQHFQAPGVAPADRPAGRLPVRDQGNTAGRAFDGGLDHRGPAQIACDFADTGARHRGANAVCTQIGNDDFAWFGTTSSKSRLNFLGLLRARHTDYVINDAALDYMRDHGLAGSLVGKLAAHEQRRFADGKA